MMKMVMMMYYMNKLSTNLNMFKFKPLLKQLLQFVYNSMVMHSDVPRDYVFVGGGVF